MSPWDGRRWFAAQPKKPPPAHGIKIKKAGTTWWGKRWIEALEHVLGADGGRLARGRTYARAGRAHDLVIESGRVTAKVTGSRATPYSITIVLPQLADVTWTKAIVFMAEQAQFAAELLAGQMPKAIDEAFHASGTSLFPAKRADLKTKCSCPDWGDPCKHVAATHYVLGEAFDRDPFLLFELRGRTRLQVLDALRAARGGSDDDGRATKKRGSPAEETEVPKVALGRVTAKDYDRPREALPAMQFSFDEPVAHGAVLRQLGAPAAWGGAGSPADVLAPLVRAAAEAARRIALAEPQAEPEPEPDPEPASASASAPEPKRQPSKARSRAPAKRRR